MEPSTSSASAQRGSTNRNARPSDKDGGEQSKTHSHRSIRYKEKFQVMREKFDNVTAMNERYQRELETANARIKKLQAENNLLLDAMSIVAEKSSIYSYLPESQQPEPLVPMHETSLAPNLPQEYRQYEPTPRSRRSSSHSSHMNGSNNGYPNGTRHRPLEAQYDPVDDASSTEYAPHSVNGH